MLMNQRMENSLHGQGSKSDLVKRPEAEAELERVFVTKADDRSNAFASVVGAHGAGKSKLNELCVENWQEKMAVNPDRQRQVHYVNVCLSFVDSATSNVTLWKEIGEGIFTALNLARAFRNLEDETKEELAKARDAFEEASTEKDVRLAIMKLFGLLKHMGRHVILVFDEVHALRKIPEKERRAFFKRLYEIAKDMTNYRISILLLSQIRMQDLIGETEEMKDFSSMYYKETVLSGFTYAEVSELCEMYGINNREAVPELAKYAGLHPFMLDELCKLVRKHAPENLTVSECYEMGKESMAGVYDWFEKSLKDVEFQPWVSETTEKVDGVVVYRQVFEPNADFFTEFELKDWLEELYKKGLVGRVKKNEPSFAKRESFVREKGYNYVPVAPHFLEYLRRKQGKQAAEVMCALRTKLHRVEKEIRKLIYDAYYKIMEQNRLFGANPNTLTAKEKWDKFNEMLILAVTNNTYATDGSRYTNSSKIEIWLGKEEYDRTSGTTAWKDGVKQKAEEAKAYWATVLDVLAFYNYYYLISWNGFNDSNWNNLRGLQCWYQVRDRLGCYKETGNSSRLDTDKMERDFDELTEARNAFAHGTEEVYFGDAEKRQKITELCDKILQSMGLEV